MREVITLHVRSIKPGNFNDSNMSESYDAGVEEWAFVETPGDMGNVVNLFDSVNLPAGTTHKFTVRFSTWTAENIIRWEGDAYKILKTEDPDKRQQYLTMFAQLKGDEDLAANT